MTAAARRSWRDLDAALGGARVARPLHNFNLGLFDGRRLELLHVSPKRSSELGTVDVVSERSGRPDTRSEMLLRQVGESDLPLVLRLDADQGLRCIDQLPKMPAADLRSVVANRLDMLTPWNEQKVYFDARAVPDSEIDGRIEIEVTVVPRRVVDTAVEALEAVGLTPHAVDLAGPDPLAEARYDLRGRAGFDRPSRVLPAILVTLAVIAFVVGGVVAHKLWREGEAIDDRQRLAGALQERLADVPQLRARIAALRGETTYIRDRKQALPSVLRVIDDLSRILPNDVWLSRMSVDGDELTATGFAADASTLLGLVEQSPFFEAAEFRAPSTRRRMLVGENELEVDAFSMAATIVMPDEAPAESER